MVFGSILFISAHVGKRKTIVIFEEVEAVCKSTFQTLKARQLEISRKRPFLGCLLWVH